MNSEGILMKSRVITGATKPPVRYLSRMGPSRGCIALGELDPSHIRAVTFPRAA